MANIIPLIISIICLVIAITIHEFSHALMADRLGDPTPRSQGRLSLNPFRHLDLVGTIMLFLVHFGWGKPVIIDPYNLKNPKRDEMLIALAGPASNLILATLISISIHFLSLNDITIILLSNLIQMNVILAIFNLIPIPPLDGSKVLLNLLPQDKSIQWEEAFSKYGLILLLAFLFLPINGTTLVSLTITPIISFVLKLLALPSF
jgi:Zn-dependent protease